MPSNKKILIIEDEKPMALALKLKLTHEGFEAEIASNGEIAIAILEKNKFNMILCDLVMPKKDGFAFLEEMQQKKNKTPVVILSNLSQPEDKKKVKALGVKDFFIKSDTPIAEIIQYVKKALK